MILDKLSSASHYTSLGPRFAAAFDFLKRTDLNSLAPGKHEIQGSDVFALVQDNETRTGLKTYEAHRQYADVQYLVRGRERMGYANIADLKVTKEYDSKDDYLLLEGEGGSMLEVPAGSFAIFLPQDAHIPGAAAGEPAKVRKVVVKVRV